MAGSGPRLLNSNRRRKEADQEGEQHEAAERIDRYVYRIDHLNITELDTVGSGCNFLSRRSEQILVSARLRGLGKTAATAFRREPGFTPS
jgi:hypothetical protein